MMKSARLLLFVILVILFSFAASAATIYGTVYDLSLKRVNNARVEINTVPKQFMVTQNGSYTFNVPKGSYTLKAQVIDKNVVTAAILENITVEQEGSYVLDLILFPNLNEGVEDPGIDLDEPIDNANYSLWIILILILIGLGFAGYYKYKKKDTKRIEKSEEYKDGDLDQIISILRKEGGRATQKDIRKQMPYSEGKISLMIAELEHKGIVEKIKKGRGNIVILKPQNLKNFGPRKP